MNEFEALKRLRQETCPATYMPDFNKEECLEVIEKAMLELQAIKEAKLKQLSGSQYTNIFIDEVVKPSEAMECLNDMERDLYVGDYYKNNIAFTKQALLKAEKQEKAWEIVKEKNVDVYLVRVSKNAEFYNKAVARRGNIYMFNLTQQEFELLKEMLK